MIEVIEVASDDYRRLLPAPVLAFDTTEFNALNAAKAGEVRHLVFADGGKARLGLIAGEVNGELRAPFSAPFAALESVGRRRIDVYLEAAAALSAWLGRRGMNARITLPPPCYASAEDADAVAKQLPALLAAPGASLAWADVNYHFDLAGDFRAGLASAPRRALNAALRNGLTFIAGIELKDAYAVVRENHLERGYPVHMSLSDVEATSHIVTIDTFAVMNGHEPAAAAIMYRTAPDAAQLIYWGDRPSLRPLRPMNLLAAGVFDYYKQQKLRILDLGPASSQGVPATGLCDFKAGLGCRLTVKPTITIRP